jgi:hypothetical protein
MDRSKQICVGTGFRGSSSYTEGKIGPVRRAVLQPALNPELVDVASHPLSIMQRRRRRGLRGLSENTVTAHGRVYIYSAVAYAEPNISEGLVVAASYWVEEAHITRLSSQ